MPSSSRSPNSLAANKEKGVSNPFAQPESSEPPAQTPLSRIKNTPNPSTAPSPSPKGNSPTPNFSIFSDHGSLSTRHFFFFPENQNDSEDPDIILARDLENFRWSHPEIEAIDLSTVRGTRIRFPEANQAAPSFVPVKPVSRLYCQPYTSPSDLIQMLLQQGLAVEDSGHLQKKICAARSCKLRRSLKTKPALSRSLKMILLSMILPPL